MSANLEANVKNCIFLLLICIAIIRVRTKVNDRGDIVSAHYGKIYGDFMQFKYYLNPTINDRNVEFDPKQNLIEGLKFDEAVKAP